MILRTGAIDDNALDRSVRKRLGTSCREDHAVYSFEGSAALPVGSQCLTDRAGLYSCSETLHTEHVGMLSVAGAVNGLAVRGIRPEEIRTDILLPVGTDEQGLRNIEDEIRNTAESAGVYVAGGHTAVTSAVTRPVVTAESFGSCPLRSGSQRSPGYVSPGHADRSGKAGASLFIIGHIGLSGTFLLAQERRKELEERFPVQMVRRASAMSNELLMTSAAEQFMTAVSETADQDLNGSTDRGETKRTDLAVMVRVSAGGIYAGLWKLARVLDCGFEVELPRIPVYQETIEICNFYGINPYQMASEGCLLAAAGSGINPERLVEDLTERNIYIRQVGYITTGRDKVILNGDERQNLNRPAADALIPLLG